MTERTSPLHPVHEAAGASFTDFGGWSMPLKYVSQLAEHRAVRESAGLFDLSHMGEVRVAGPEAPALLDHALVAPVLTAHPTEVRRKSMIDHRNRIAELLRLSDAGAAEIHMRIASPPTRHSCFYGVDTPERAKLLAAKLDVDQPVADSARA